MVYLRFRDCDASNVESRDFALYTDVCFWTNSTFRCVLSVFTIFSFVMIFHRHCVRVFFFSEPVFRVVSIGHCIPFQCRYTKSFSSGLAETFVFITSLPLFSKRFWGFLSTFLVDPNEMFLLHDLSILLSSFFHTMVCH